MERHNRKSHLAPQLSPSTQELLRSDPISSPSKESSASKTPTSGEISIASDNMKPSPSSDNVTIQRTLPTELNGAGMYPSSNPTFSRQAFPPRTSSTSGSIPGALTGRSRENDSVTAAPASQLRPKDSDSFSLPIRPAAPGGGPGPSRRLRGFPPRAPPAPAPAGRCPTYRTRR